MKKLFFLILAVFTAGSLATSCKDTGTDAQPGIHGISFRNIGSDTLSITYNREYIIQSTVTMVPADAKVPPLVWTSSNPEVQIGDKVGGACKVLATVQDAVSTITVSTEDGAYSASIIVCANGEVETAPLTGFHFRIVQDLSAIPGAVVAQYTADDINNCSVLNITLNGTSYVYVEIMYEPEDTDYQMPSYQGPDGTPATGFSPWSTPSPTGICNANAGNNAAYRTDAKIVRLLPRAVGTMTITATINGIVKPLTVNIIPYTGAATVTSMAFAQPSYTMELNTDFPMTCNVVMNPATAAVPTDLVWTSSNPDIQIVSPSGNQCVLKSAVEGATSTITCKTSDGAITATTTVTATSGTPAIPLQGIYIRVVQDPVNNLPLATAVETKYVADNLNCTASIDAELPNTKYVYVEVKPYPAGATLSATPVWDKGGSTFFNIPTAVGNTGRSDVTACRIVPVAAGSGALTVTVGEFKASLSVNIVATGTITDSPALTGIYLRVIQNPVPYLMTVSGGATINNLTPATIACTPVSGENCTALTVNAAVLSTDNFGAYIQVMPIPTNAAWTTVTANPWTYTGTGMNGTPNAGTGGTGVAGFRVTRMRPATTAGSGTLSVTANGFTATLLITVQ